MIYSNVCCSILKEDVARIFHKANDETCTDEFTKFLYWMIATPHTHMRKKGDGACNVAVQTSVHGLFSPSCVVCLPNDSVFAVRVIL